MTFPLDVRRRAGLAVVAPVGDLDVHTAGALRTVLDELSAEDTRDDVVVDLAGCDFLDSSALGVFVGAMKKLEAAGRRIGIVSSKPHLVKVLQITRLTEVIAVGEDVETVLAPG